MQSTRSLPLVVLSAALAACSSEDAAQPAPPADAAADTSVVDASHEAAPPSDASAPDAADSAYVPTPCNPQNDTCGGARKCCPVKRVNTDAGPDSGFDYGCVFVKPPADTCPPLP
jgi:hypothetical protein